MVTMPSQMPQLKCGTVYHIMSFLSITLRFLFLIEVSFFHSSLLVIFVSGLQTDTVIMDMLIVLTFLLTVNDSNQQHNSSPQWMTYPLSSRQYHWVCMQNWSRESDQVGWTVQVVYCDCTLRTPRPPRQLHAPCGWHPSTNQEPGTDHCSDEEVLPSAVSASPVDLCIHTSPHMLIARKSSTTLICPLATLYWGYDMLIMHKLTNVHDLRCSDNIQIGVKNTIRAIFE